MDAASLGLIHAYNPGLSSAWMLQRAMSVRRGESPPPNMINRMLSGNFQAMEGLGDPVLKPFLQASCRPVLAQGSCWNGRLLLPSCLHSWPARSRAVPRPGQPG
jgi:hypothetical protein